MFGLRETFGLLGYQKQSGTVTILLVICFLACRQKPRRASMCSSPAKVPWFRPVESRASTKPTASKESSGGIGKTPAEMQTAGTFFDTGWDFVDETENGTDDIWWILEGRGYPRLWWELIEDESMNLAEDLPA